MLKGRKIIDLDADAEVTLVDEAQPRNDDDLMFDTGVLDEPKARGVVVREPSEFTTTTSQPSQLPQAKEKVKAKMIEPKKPLKRKDQILIDEEISQRLQEELQVKLEEEERLTRQKEEEDNLISWDNTQAMMEADYELAQRLQAEEQGELTIKERSKLFVELMDKRKKHIAKLRAEEIRRKPPTKAQKRNQMYSFVPMDSEVVEGSKSQAEGNKNVEDEVDDEAEMKKHMEIVPDDEVAINAIPLATKSPIIVDWKIIKEGKMGYLQIIRVDGSSRRPEEAYERVLWGDLKVMFESDVESKGRIVRIKRLHDDLGVNTAKVRVIAAKHNLVLLLKDLEEILLKLVISASISSCIGGSREVIWRSMVVARPRWKVVCGVLGRGCLNL
ncbi:hypothetical protein Tco_0516464 [Tanacetum coccineum]